MFIKEKDKYNKPCEKKIKPSGSGPFIVKKNMFL